MVSYKLLTTLTVIFDVILFCNGAKEVFNSGVQEPEAKGLKILIENYDIKELECQDILLKVGLVYKKDTADGLLNYCFVKDFDSYDTFKEYAMKKIGRMDDKTEPREMGYFYTIYTQINLAEIKVILMAPHFFCYIKRLAEIKNEKEEKEEAKKANNTLWNFIYAKLSSNIFAQEVKEDELSQVKEDELSPDDETVMKCQLSISSYEFIHDGKTYSYDMENPYKNFLTSYKIANLIKTVEGAGGIPLSLSMDDHVRSYFDVHAKQLNDNINKLETFTIPELCKSKFSAKDQEETKNDAQQVTKENEASVGLS